MIDLAKPEDEIVKEIRAACLDKGFFQIVHHGVARELQEEVFDVSKRFFSLPIDTKMQYFYRNSAANRGYERSFGQVLEVGAEADSKEGFYYGENFELDDPKVKEGLFGHGPNQNPSEVPDFDPVLNKYFHSCMDLAHRLLKYICLSLDMPLSHFEFPFFQDSYGIIRLLHYPPAPATRSDKYRSAGAHTDFGAITLLMQDEVGGLQVLDRDEGWVDVQPVKDAYVINLGDAMHRWTNSKYHSNTHRVVEGGSTGDRYSVPFFFSGNMRSTIKAIPTTLDDGVAKYPPIKLQDHYLERYGTTYGTSKKRAESKVDEGKPVSVGA